jgi:hypothetical protein
VAFFVLAPLHRIAVRIKRSSMSMLVRIAGSHVYLSYHVVYSKRVHFATALNYFAYNFIKIHRTLRTSPAMAAGVTDRPWSVEDLVARWEAYEQGRAERAA